LARDRLKDSETNKKGEEGEEERDPEEEEDEEGVSTATATGGGGAMRSMDDERLFGPIVYRLKCADAVRLGLTVPVKLAVVRHTQLRPPPLRSHR